MSPLLRAWPALGGLLFATILPPLAALELPPDCLARLRDERFRTREEAQKELLDWARGRRGEAMDELLRQSREAPDPEVRARCLAVLRDLVGDEYLRDGEGYIGVQMLNEFANVPGEARPRAAIRVAEVLADTAAAAAGLKVGDLIVGLNGEVWHQGPLAIPFGEKVREFKPGDTIKLQLLRDGKVVDQPLKLGRRPAYADLPFPGLTDEDKQAAEKAAREAHFRRWLGRRPPAK